MFWIVQGNLKTDEGLNALMEVLRTEGYAHSLVKTIPFSNIIVGVDVDINQFSEDDVPRLEISNDKQMVTMGSYSLALTAKEKGWVPGSFINEKFEFSKWLSGWGKDNLLNGEAIEDSVKNIIPMITSGRHKVFARPSEDTKSFAGQLFEADNLIFWLGQVATSVDRFGLNGDTSIIVSPAKKILAEYRLFVVDGQIVTGSLYKVGDLVTTSDVIDPVAIEYANKMLTIWQPDRAFVLDIAITDDGPKIIEVNNINSSGFYKSDISKIVSAIDKMIF
jgi:hypothetical protein